MKAFRWYQSAFSVAAFSLYPLALPAAPVQEVLVEVIVFEQRAASTAESAAWPSDLPLPNYETAAPPEPPDSTGAATKPHAFELPPRDYKLTSEFKLLAKSKNYVPLLHTAWRQALAGETAALPVRVLKQENDFTVLDGTLLIRQNEHPALRADIVYQVPKGPRFRLQQNARLKLGEIHYLDHPKLGAVVLVTATTAPSKSKE